MKRISAIILMMSTLFLSLSTFSLNYSFMHESTMDKLTGEDWAMAKHARIKALQLPNGQKAEWNNPETKHHGYVEALSDEVIEGKKCRKLRISTQTAHHADKYVFTYCQFKDGWKVIR